MGALSLALVAMALMSIRRAQRGTVLNVGATQ
jgi:hypothetical protein